MIVLDASAVVDWLLQTPAGQRAYDGAYVALAEELKAPLLTRDQKIAAAPGHSATIEVF